MDTRKAAVMEGLEEVKHEENKYEIKAARTIEMPSADTEVNAAGYPTYMNQEAMMYTGLIYSRRPRPAEPSLDSDKLDLTDIIS